MNTSRVLFLRVAIVITCAGVWVAASPASPSIQDPPNPNVERLLKTRECRGCDFTGTSIINKDLTGVDVSGASFEGASLYASNLTGANLTGVNFRDAVLKRTDLKDAALDLTDMSGADISFAMNANLQSAGTTSTTTCPDLSSGPCR